CPSEIRSTSTATESMACSMRSRRAPRSCGSSPVFRLSHLRPSALANAVPTTMKATAVMIPTGTMNGDENASIEWLPWLVIGVCRHSRQVQGYCRAAGLSSLGGNCTIVRGDDLPHDSQAEPRAGGLGGYVWLPDAREHVIRHARPGI